MWRKSNPAAADRSPGEIVGILCDGKTKDSFISARVMSLTSTRLLMWGDFPARVICAKEIWHFSRILGEFLAVFKSYPHQNQISRAALLWHNIQIEPKETQTCDKKKCKEMYICNIYSANWFGSKHVKFLWLKSALNVKYTTFSCFNL